MARCAAIKPNGQSCKGEAIAGSDWCYSHDPANAAQRRRNASKGGKNGGRGRAQAEVGDIKEQLSDLAQQVLDGSLEINKAYAVNALVGTRLRAIELERKIKETDELEARIVELELAQEAKNGKWEREQLRGRNG